MNKPILIFSEGISYCHIIRPLILYLWLRELDVSIIVACTKKAEPLFHAEGAHIVNIETADPEKIYKRLAKGSFIYSKDEFLNYYKSDDALIKKINPSLVIADFRFTILHLAKSRNIPTVGLTSATCHPNFPLSKTTPNAFIRPSFIPVGVFDRLHNSWFGRSIQSKVIVSISRNYREASRQFGMAELGTFFDYASQGDLCLLCDDPEVMPLPSLRSQDLYTGAMLWKRDEPLPYEISKSDPSLASVYITIGTQNSLDTRFIKPLVDGLRKENYKVIISKGNRNISLNIDDKNVFVYDFLNESKVLQQVDLYIYHGSAMSTYQGLASGTPMIAIPAQADQHFHSEALIRLGVGTLYRPLELRIDSLVRKAKEYINDQSIQRRAESLCKRIKERSSKDEVRTRILELIHQPRVGNTPSRQKTG